MLQPISRDSSPINSPAATCKNTNSNSNSSSGGAIAAATAETRVISIIKNMSSVQLQRRKGAGGGLLGGTSGGGGGGGAADGIGSPSSLSSDTSSFSILAAANGYNTSPLNPCLLILLALVVLSMNIQSMIQLDSPLANMMGRRQPEPTLLRKTATTHRATTTAAEQGAASIVSTLVEKKSIPNYVNHDAFVDNNNAKKTTTALALSASGGEENNTKQQRLYTVFPPRANGIVPDIVKPGDFIYYTPTEDWDSVPIVIEEYKLIFFTIAKVGCTVWKQLFRRMLGHEDWKSQDHGLPHDPRTNGLRYLSDYSLQEASRFMTDPTWTRAIMVRDPKTRFLSAFLDKAVSNDHDFIRARCCRQNFACIAAAQTIPGFLQLAAVCNDGHWRRQHERVDVKYWPYMDFVLHVETAASDARALLQHLPGGDAWEKYGASGWAAHDATTPGDKSSLAIFENKDAQGAGEHVTHSEWKHWIWYTPESERQVEAFYRSDYENPLFRFSHDCLTCINNETTSSSSSSSSATMTTTTN